MSPVADTSWTEQARERLRGAGYRRGGARSTVIDAMAEHDCAVTALELEEELRAGKSPPGRASIYRALEQLEQLGLLQRIEVGRGMAGFERVEPSGDHHHHAICQKCGRMVPFENRSLERAIDRAAGEISFAAANHEVVIRGTCEKCAR